MSWVIGGHRWCVDADYPGITEKTIHDDETSDVDLAESMGDLKVRCCGKRENRR